MMFRPFASIAVTALAVATLFVAADPASAQLRRGFRGGYSPEPGYYGYGNPYYGEGWRYPANSGYGWSTPGYQWSGTGYWSNPSYYGQGMQGDYSSSFGAGYGDQAYGAMSGSAMNNQALITVRVPPNAEVWFDDQKTSQTGSMRTFVTPPLDSDRNFVYHVRARWTENGRSVEKTRKYDVHPGDRVFAIFFNPRSQGMMGTSTGEYGAPGYYSTEPRTGTENRSRTSPNNRQQGETDRQPEEKP